MGALIPLPGVDIVALADAPSPCGRTLVIRERSGWILLGAEPSIVQSGWTRGWRFRAASQARSHALDLCLQFPRLFHHIVDETQVARPTAAAAGVTEGAA